MEVHTTATNRFPVLRSIFALAIALFFLFPLSACADMRAEPAPTLEAASEPIPEPTPESTPEPTPTHQDSGGNAIAFPYRIEAIDLYGNAVTAETLGEKEVFFLHVWATWCPPCIAEMPDFPELVRNYEDRVGFLALLIDYDEAKDLAIEIYRDLDIPDSFYTVDALDPGVLELLGLLDSGYVPTTVLVSKDGAGRQIVGSAGLDGYSEQIDALLD